MLDSSETAGLRIDDIVLFFMGCFLMWTHAFSEKRLLKIEGLILVLTAFSIFSYLTNRLFVSLDLLHLDAKIFYAIRLLEYFLFFYIGALSFRYANGNAMIKIFFIFNLILMSLQKFNLAGGILSAGYHSDVSDRVQGIASFPSEMGLILNLLFCFMVFDDTQTSNWVNFFHSPTLKHFLRKLYPYWMFSLFAVFVIFTGNRISILALFICFLFRLKQDMHLRSLASWILLGSLIPFLIVGAFYLIGQTAAVYERSLELFSWKNVELMQIVWDKIDITQEPLGREIVDANYDMSWWLRIHKWLFALKSYLSNPECYLQGLGPGFCGAALDGGWLRIIVEYGLLGAILFWKFFGMLYRLNRQTKWMLVAFSINMLFFDAYLAYKSMSVLLFACGYLFQKKLNANATDFHLCTS